MVTAIKILLIFVLAIACILATWKKVPQDKAMVITGVRKKVLTGGGGVVIPILERYDVMSLEAINLTVISKKTLTSLRVPINITGVAVIKVANDSASILSATERFFKGSEEKTIEEIKIIATEILEGKLREIVSGLTAESVYHDRKEFGQQVQEVAHTELSKMGLSLETFTIKDINDDESYYVSLGKEQIAKVQKNADIAVAEARRETTEKVAEADRLAAAARIMAETQIAEAQKVKELKVQSYIKEQETAKAEAELAFELKQNEIKQILVREKVKIDVVEKEEQINVARQEAVRKEKEYEAEVLKKADAEKYRVEKIAEADKYRKVQEAEAKAKAIEIESEAEAKAKERIGLAEAAATKAVLLAEADGMKEKAQAWKEYNDAALAQMKIDVLPRIAEAIAAPLAKIEKITIIDGGSGAGASRLTDYAVDIIGKLPVIFDAISGKSAGENLGEFLKEAKLVESDDERYKK